MLKFLGILTVFVVFWGTADAQVSNAWWCPSVNTMPNFDFRRYLGSWYFHERIPSNEEFNLTCSTATYTVEGNEFVLRNRYYKNRTSETRAITGKTNYDPNYKDSRFGVTYDAQYPHNYFIIDTDYVNYAVVYSCVDFFFVHYEFAWVLRRKRYNLFPSKSPDVRKILEKNTGLSGNHLQFIDQKNCPLFH